MNGKQEQAIMKKKERKAKEDERRTINAYRKAQQEYRCPAEIEDIK